MSQDSSLAALHFFQQLHDSNQSLHTTDEAKVTVDEIEAPEKAEADAMCLDINCCSLAGMQVACDQCIKLYD